MLANLQVLATKQGAWSVLGSKGAAKSVASEAIKTSQLSLAFFDRLTACGAVRGNGSIAGCIPETVNDLPVNNKIGRLLLSDEDEHYDIFDASDRSELLFHVLRFLIIGGPLNQVLLQ